MKKILNPQINIFQVPRNGSSDCIHWFPFEQTLLLNRCSEYYSKFKANVYLILPGENPINNPSAEVMSGIVITNSMRDPMQKCAIVVTNSRGVCRQKLSLIEDKHNVAKEKCLELMEKKGKLEHDLPQVQQNLESLIALNTSINNVEGLDQWQTLVQQTVEELTSKKKDYLRTTKEFEENSKIVGRLQSWQEVVTIYHTDNLFASSATTVVTTNIDQSQDCKTPKAYLDMSTLVEWSPDGYLSKLKQHIDEQPQRKVLTFSTNGKDITNTLFKMDTIHLVQTYSVDSPWNTDDWEPTQEVWVVKETLSDEQLQHAIYIELDHSNPTKRHYQVYHYETRSQACLWTRAYKSLPNSSEACKIQLIDTE